MRARNIKPSFFKNEELIKLPESVRLLFIGLWCLADRRGRLEDRPLRIKMELYPCDQHDVSTMLEQLQHHGFILRYEVNQNRYIQVINFEKHQYPHIKEQASTIPAPCKPGASTMDARLNPSSLNPSSLNPESLIPAAPGKTGLRIFETLWAEYPKRLGKKNAERHFRATVKTDVDVQNIQKALANFRRHVAKTEPQFIQHGDTWFNNWQDWIDFKEPTGGPNGTNGGTSIFVQAARRQRAKEAEIVRIDPGPGAIFDRFRNMPDVSTENGGNAGGGTNGHAEPVAALRHKDPVEAAPDGEHKA